jgi:hypothetical protein
MTPANARRLGRLTLVSLAAIGSATPAFSKSSEAGGPVPVGAGAQAVSAFDIPILTTLAVMNASQARATADEGSAAPIFTDDDELILLVRTERLVLGEAMTAYGNRDGVYLPLGELVRVLDLAIVVDPSSETASGWFLSESRTFSLSLAKAEVIVSGQRFELKPRDAIARDGEIYVRTERLSEWFPAKFNVSLSALAVQITTSEPFPFEARLARDAARDRLASRGGDRNQRLPFESTPYRALTIPSIDVVTRLAQTERRGTEYQYDVRASGDFAFMAADAFIGGDDLDGLTSARITLSRTDPDGDLLGPLQARQFSIGDVFAPSLGLGPRSVGGRGMLLSNTPIDRASVFDRLDLRGPLPNGFEVELYRNNVLIGSTNEAVDGNYEFLQIPLDFGANIFRFVFYGPRGERREEVRQVNVGDGRLSQGELHYTIAAAQRDTSLFEVRDSKRTAQRDAGSWESSIQLDYGLSPFMTLSSGLQRFERFNTPTTLAVAGLRTSIGGVAVRLDAATQSPGGSAIQLGAGGRLAGITYGLTHAEYNGDFLDEVRRPAADFYTRQTDAQLAFAVPMGSGSLPFQFRALRGEFANGNTDIQASLRTGWNYANINWSNNFDYDRFTSTLSSQEQFRGSLTASTSRFGKGQLRASFDYAILPSFEASSLSLDYDQSFGPDVRGRFQVSQDLRRSSTRLGASVSRTLRTYELALDGFYDTQTQDYTIGLRLGFSLGRNPLDGQIVRSRPGLAQGGNVAALVFKDLNGNNKFDQGEEGVSGVRLRGASSATATTNAAGIAFIPNLGEKRRVSVTLDATSLESIYTQSAKGTFEILPRAGRIHVTNIPLVDTGEVEGEVRLLDASGARAVSAVALLILDDKGTIVKALRSESEGYFLVETLPTGTYSLVLDPEQAERLKLELVSPITFTVQGSDAATISLQVDIKSK